MRSACERRGVTGIDLVVSAASFASVPCKKTSQRKPLATRKRGEGRRTAATTQCQPADWIGFAGRSQLPVSRTHIYLHACLLLHHIRGRFGRARPRSFSPGSDGSPGKPSGLIAGRFRPLRFKPLLSSDKPNGGTQ